MNNYLTTLAMDDKFIEDIQNNLSNSNNQEDTSSNEDHNLSKRQKRREKIKNVFSQFNPKNEDNIYNDVDDTMVRGTKKGGGVIKGVIERTKNFVNDIDQEDIDNVIAGVTQAGQGYMEARQRNMEESDDFASGFGSTRGNTFNTTNYASGSQSRNAGNFSQSRDTPQNMNNATNCCCGNGTHDSKKSPLPGHFNSQTGTVKPLQGYLPDCKDAKKLVWCQLCDLLGKKFEEGALSTNCDYEVQKQVCSLCDSKKYGYYSGSNKRYYPKKTTAKKASPTPAKKKTKTKKSC